MIVVYSLAVRPAPLIRSLSRCRGMTLTIRITARHSSSSLADSGSSVAIRPGYLLRQAIAGTLARPGAWREEDGRRQR